MGKEYFSTATGESLKENSEELNNIKNTKFELMDSKGNLIEKPENANMIGYSVKANNNNGGVEILGERRDQEDRMIIAEELPGFDQLSDYEPPNAKPNAKPAQESARKQVIRKTFAQAQASLQNIKEGGSTAVVSITQGNYIYTAGLGDSVSYKVVRRKSTGEVISCQRLNRTLHKPTELTEVERIEKDYGKGNIKKDAYGTERLGRELSMTRAFGDNDFKKFGLISDPGEIYCDKIVDDPQKLDSDIEIFQITACDGLTEPAEKIDNPNFSKDPLVNNLKQKLEEEPYKKFEHKDEKYIAKLFTESKELLDNNPDLSIVATAFAKQAMKDGSKDNISISLRRLDPKNEKAELVAVFDGHGGKVVSEALADEKTGFLAVLKDNIKKALEQKKEYIQKLRKSLAGSTKDFGTLSNDTVQSTSYAKAQALFNQRNNKKFVAEAASYQPLREEIYNDAKADPEAAKQIFLAKSYTKLAGGFIKPKEVLSAKQIAELLQAHAEVAGFVDKVCDQPEKTTVDLVKLAKADVTAFEIIVSTPKLFAKLDDKKRKEIVRFYLAHPHEEALNIMINKPELYRMAGRKNLIKMATSYIQKDNNPKFCYSRDEIKRALQNETKSLSLALAQLYADAGSPRAQYYLSVLYDAYANEKTKNQGKKHREQMAEISFQWLEKAANAKKGPVEAKCDLAAYYLEKISRPKLPLQEKEGLIQKTERLTNDARKSLRLGDKQNDSLNKRINSISKALLEQKKKLVNKTSSVPEQNNGSSRRYSFIYPK